MPKALNIRKAVLNLMQPEIESQWTFQEVTHPFLHVCGVAECVLQNAIYTLPK